MQQLIEEVEVVEEEVAVAAVVVEVVQSMMIDEINPRGMMTKEN